MTNENGSIWDQEDKVVMKVGETTYNVLKQDKTHEKQPDWKGDDVAIWDKISQKGNTYRFIKIGEEDYWKYSLHNIRKTHGMWLKTLQHRGRDLDVSEICMRLGHDMNTFLKHYGSPSVFSDQDRDKMIEVLGDIYGFK